MFFSGNDVYDWCRYDRKAARSYVAGLFDSAAHAAAVIDSTRNFGSMPNNDVQVEFALKRVVDIARRSMPTLSK